MAIISILTASTLRAELVKLGRQDLFPTYVMGATRTKILVKSAPLCNIAVDIVGMLEDCGVMEKRKWSSDRIGRRRLKAYSRNWGCNVRQDKAHGCRWSCDDDPPCP